MSEHRKEHGALMGEDWALVPELFRTAQRTMRVAKLNLGFTAAHNVLRLKAGEVRAESAARGAETPLPGLASTNLTINVMDTIFSSS